MTNQDRIIALIRTVVPALYGSVLAWLIGKVPAVADAFAWLSATFEQDVVAAFESAFVVLIIAGFYAAARWAGARWPWLEKWLLGRSLVPVYDVNAAYEQLNGMTSEEAALFAAGKTRKVAE